MTEKRFLDARSDDQIVLRKWGALPETTHVFERATKIAINAALAAERPLLVRGEPGTGKSQLARAAAEALGRALVARTVDARTESRDLCWSFDAVSRLAQAQVLAAERAESTQIAVKLDERCFLRPGPLWWAFDWVGAQRQARHAGAREPSRPEDWTEDQGVVLLLDEIDKADSSVPNGLLEALGSGRFDAPGYPDGVVRNERVTPLVIVTTNEERALPDAFLRRCLVLHLKLPTERAELLRWLQQRGAVHAPGCFEGPRARAAELLIEDRDRARKLALSPPGQAEYLDLLQALVAQRPGDARGQMELLELSARYVLRKHPELDLS